MENEHIIHEGIISSKDADTIQVTIESKSACASCHANGACNAADKGMRTIDIPRNPLYHNLQIGDHVMVEGNFSSGLKAVLFAYVIPFLLILVTLILMAEITQNNLVAGLTSLGVTIPYFTIVYFNRKKFEKQFSFTIKQ